MIEPRPHVENTIPPELLPEFHARVYMLTHLVVHGHAPSYELCVQEVQTMTPDKLKVMVQSIKDMLLIKALLQL